MLSSNHPAGNYRPSASAKMASPMRRVTPESIDDILVDSDTDSESSFYTKKPPAINYEKKDDSVANQKRSNFNARKSVVAAATAASVAASPFRNDSTLASLKRTIEFPPSKEQIPDLQVIPRSSDEEDNDDDLARSPVGKVHAVASPLAQPKRLSLESDSSSEDSLDGMNTSVPVTNELDVSNGAPSIAESSTSDTSSGMAFQPSVCELVKTKARKIDLDRQQTMAASTRNKKARTSKETEAPPVDVDDSKSLANNKNDSILHWQKHIAPVLQYCGVCKPCRLKPCGQCRLCVATNGKLAGRASEGQSGSKMKMTFSYCLFKCCVRHYKVQSSHTLPVMQWYQSELDYERDVIDQQLLEESKLGAKYFRFEVDQPVYCWWPDSQKFFDAKIFRRYKVNTKGCISKLYSVHFTDGSNDKRSRVPEREILTLYQMQVLLERDRYETILENLPSAINNATDDGATGTASATTAGIECSASKEADIAETTKAISTATDKGHRSNMNGRADDASGATLASKEVCVNSKPSSLATTTQHYSKYRKVGSRCFFRWPDQTPLYYSGIIVVAEGNGSDKSFIIEAQYNNSLKKFKVESHLVFSEAKFMMFEHCLDPKDRAEISPTLNEGDSSDLEPGIPHEPIVTPDFVGSGDGGSARSTASARRVYSTSKILGARCYARWQGNGKFYWGYIEQVTGHGLTRRYSVRFDDGDSCDGIRPWQLFSEAEYKRRTRLEPPVPKGQGIDVDGNAIEPSAAHALFGLGFCQNWIDFAGRNRVTYGKIGRAIDASDPNTENTFEVTYVGDDDVSDEVVTPQLHDTISEKVAWGGHMAYVASIEPQKYTADTNLLPFHVKWILPDFRKYDNLGCLIMKFRGFRLYLAPQESTMPGAGLGLFLKVVDVSGASRSHFVLSEGELLCLGTYGPCSPNDYKKIHVFEIKCFIHEFAPESYCFESKDFLVDITDDHTGELHALASASLLCRVNETDGKDTPCVCAERDPSGSIQYFLGHAVEGQGDLSIPVDTPYELKIDYGDLYERQRVRCNYPRIKGRKLEDTKRAITNSDEEALHDCSFYTQCEVHECLLFLESLFCPTWHTTNVKLQRSLVIALALRRRSVATQGNGVDDSDPHRTVQRSNKIVKSICDSFGEHFRDGVFSCAFLKSAVVELFGGVDISTIKTFPTALIYNKIVSGK